MDTLQHRAVDTEPLLIATIAQNPIVVFSISGGKDSAAAAFAANAYLDTLGHDRSRRAVIHADLGRIEWRSTPAIVEQLAARLRLPLIVVRRSAGDLIARWQQRFEAGKQRYTDLRTMMLVGPFSSSALRFCTSELKTHVIAVRAPPRRSPRDFPVMLNPSSGMDTPPAGIRSPAGLKRMSMLATRRAVLNSMKHTRSGARPAWAAASACLHRSIISKPVPRLRTTERRTV
jgi:hypothetical protein